MHVIAREMTAARVCGASGVHEVGVDDIEAQRERVMPKALKTPTRG
jgi:hypothetical protein